MYLFRSSSASVVFSKPTGYKNVCATQYIKALPQKASSGCVVS